MPKVRAPSFSVSLPGIHATCTDASLGRGAADRPCRTRRADRLWIEQKVRRLGTAVHPLVLRHARLPGARGAARRGLLVPGGLVEPRHHHLRDADRIGRSRSTVQRWLRLFELRPPLTLYEVDMPAARSMANPPAALLPRKPPRALPPRPRRRRAVPCRCLGRVQESGRAAVGQEPCHAARRTSERSVPACGAFQANVSFSLARNMCGAAFVRGQ